MPDLSKLAAEFPREAVHWRVQGQPYKGRNGYAAMALAYIDARDVMDRLDEVCGPDGWRSEIAETASGRVICTLSIYCGPERGWVPKSDGAGGTQVEAEKGGISDSLKRAAVSWGVGRYLYRLDSPWVACEVKEKGGKVYWKAWAEDPWSKVRQTKFVPPTPAEPEEAPRQNDTGTQAPPVAASVSSQTATGSPSDYTQLRDQLKEVLSRCVSQDDFDQVWEREKKARNLLWNDDRPKGLEIANLKKTLRATLPERTPLPTAPEPAEPY